MHAVPESPEQVIVGIPLGLNVSAQFELLDDEH